MRKQEMVSRTSCWDVGVTSPPLVLIPSPDLKRQKVQPVLSSGSK